METVKHLPEWFPGASFRRQARIGKCFMDAMREEPFEYVKTCQVQMLY